MHVSKAIRRGELMTAAVITEALHITGDLERYEPEPVTYTSPQWTAHGVAA